MQQQTAQRHPSSPPSSQTASLQRELEQNVHDYAVLAAMCLNQLRVGALQAPDHESLRSHLNAEHEELSQLAELVRENDHEGIAELMRIRSERLKGLPASTRDLLANDATAQNGVESELGVLNTEASRLFDDSAVAFNLQSPQTVQGLAATQVQESRRPVQGVAEDSVSQADQSSLEPAPASAAPEHDLPPVQSDEPSIPVISASDPESRIDQLFATEGTSAGDRAQLDVDTKASMPDNVQSDFIVGPPLEEQSILGPFLPLPEEQQSTGAAEEEATTGGGGEPEGKPDSEPTKALAVREETAIVHVPQESSDEKPGFFKRYRVALAAAVIALTTAGGFFALRGHLKGNNEDQSDSVAAAVENQEASEADATDDAPLAQDSAQGPTTVTPPFTAQDTVLGPVFPQQEPFAVPPFLLPPEADQQEAPSLLAERPTLLTPFEQFLRDLEESQQMAQAPQPEVADSDLLPPFSEFVPDSESATPAPLEQAAPDTVSPPTEALAGHTEDTNAPFSAFIPEESGNPVASADSTDSAAQPAVADKPLREIVDVPFSAFAPEDSPLPSFGEFVPEAQNESASPESDNKPLEAQGLESGDLHSPESGSVSSASPRSFSQRSFSSFIPQEEEGGSAELDDQSPENIGESVLQEDTRTPLPAFEDFLPTESDVAREAASTPDDAPASYRIEDYNPDGTRKAPASSSLSGSGLGFEEFTPSTGEEYRRGPVQDHQGDIRERGQEPHLPPVFVPGGSVVAPGAQVGLPGHVNNLNHTQFEGFIPAERTQREERTLFADNLQRLEVAHFAPQGEENPAQEETRPFRDDLSLSEASFAPQDEEEAYAFFESSTVSKANP